MFQEHQRAYAGRAPFPTRTAEVPREIGDCQSTPQSPTANCLKETYSVVECIERSIDDLEQQIAPILRPSPPAPAGIREDTPAAPQSELATMLAGITDRLIVIHNRLQELRQRSEI